MAASEEREKVIRAAWAERGKALWNPETHGRSLLSLYIPASTEVRPVTLPPQKLCGTGSKILLQCAAGVLAACRHMIPASRLTCLRPHGRKSRRFRLRPDFPVSDRA
jgi:hypothetical protein